MSYHGIWPSLLPYFLKKKITWNLLCGAIFVFVKIWTCVHVSIFSNTSRFFLLKRMEENSPSPHYIKGKTTSTNMNMEHRTFWILQYRAISNSSIYSLSFVMKINLINVSQLNPTSFKTFHWLLVHLLSIITSTFSIRQVTTGRLVDIT